MIKMYVLAGYGVNDNRVFVKKEVAEEACKKYNYHKDMCGSRERAYVKEVEVVVE